MSEHGAHEGKPSKPKAHAKQHRNPLLLMRAKRAIAENSRAVDACVRKTRLDRSRWGTTGIKPGDDVPRRVNRSQRERKFSASSSRFRPTRRARPIPPAASEMARSMSRLPPRLKSNLTSTGLLGQTFHNANGCAARIKPQCGNITGTNRRPSPTCREPTRECPQQSDQCQHAQP